MGTFHRAMTLYSDNSVTFETVEALVDTGATFSLVPRPILERLGIEPEDELSFTLADGRTITRPIGQVGIEVEDRRTVTWFVFGEPESMPLLGAYALEGLRLTVDSFNKRLVPLRGYLAIHLQSR